MKKSTLADLPELVAAGLLDEAQVERIRAYYTGSVRSSRAPLLVFALVGALLLGAGVIQIFAYNWDALPRLLRAGIAVLITVPPLVAVAYGRMRRTDSSAWREAPAALLMLMIGGSIGLMAQIYHVIPGDIPFALLWAVLALPVVFYTGAVSAVIGLAVIASVYLALWFESLPTWPFWFFYCVVAWNAIRSCAEPSRFASRLLQTTLLAMSGCILIRVFIDGNGSILIIQLGSLAGAAYLFSVAEFRTARFPSYPLRVIPSVLMILIMAVFSFTEPWDDIADKGWSLLAEGFGGTDIPATVFGLAVLALYPVSAALAFRRLRSGDIPFVVFPVFFAGMIGVAQNVTPDATMIAMSAFVFGSGVLLAARGVMEHSFGLLNLGMLMTAWILLVRFFDSDISLLFKGIVFLVLGAGFIGMNLLMARRRA